MNILPIIIFISFFLFGCKALPSIPSIDRHSSITSALSAGQPYEKQLFDKDPDIWTIKADLEDKTLDEHLQKVMDKLWPFYKDEVYHYYVHIDQNPYVQSLIVLPPNNQVYISYSLLNIISNDDELACLLAHEIGHIGSYKYEKEQDSKRTRRGLFEKLLDMTGLGGGIKDWAVRQRNKINLSQVSQEIEMKADLYGAKLAAKAGYDPFALTDLLNRLAQIKGDSFVYELSKLKGTHPTLKHRAQVLQEELTKEGYKHGVPLDKDSYAHMMTWLWQDSFALAGQQASKSEFYEDWQKIQTLKNKVKGSHQLSSQEFLELMGAIQALAKKYDLTREDVQSFSSDGKERYFVGEKIYVPYPEFFSEFDLKLIA